MMMTLDTLLQEIGLTVDQVAGVLADEWFQVRDEATLRERLCIIQETYGCTRQQIGEVIMKFPPFAGYDHARVISETEEVYGVVNTERVKEAILKHPPFVSLDHARVLRQAARLGKLVDLSSGQCIEKIMQNPVLANYSAKRSLAVIDIGRLLVREGYNPKEMLDVYFACCSISPYLPGRKRISQAFGPEPPMMKVMRRRLKKLDES